MAKSNGQQYLEDRLTSLGYHELFGARSALADLQRLADNATSLNECYEIHKAATELGTVNKNLDVDPYGIVRAGSLDNFTVSDIFLGNKYGIWTANIPEFELVKENRPDAYMVALNQYKTFLSANFKDMGAKVVVARGEEEAEANRTALQKFFGGHKYPRRGPDTKINPEIPENRTSFVGFYSAAVGGDSNRLLMMLDNEEVRHNPLNMLIDMLGSRGGQGQKFCPEIEAFNGWNPAFKVQTGPIGGEGERYRVEWMQVADTREDDKGLFLFCSGPNDKKLDIYVDSKGVKVSQDGAGKVSADIKNSVKEQLPRVLSNAYVNMDWQFRRDDKKAAEMAKEKLQAEKEERARRTDEAKTELFRNYTAKDFRALFAAAESIPGKVVTSRPHPELHATDVRTRHGSFEYHQCAPGFELSDSGVLAKEVRNTDDGRQMPIRLCFERSNSYGDFPDGNEMLFENGRPDEFRTNALRWDGDEYFSSNSIYFRADGSIDEQKTRESEGNGDYVISYTGILETLKQMEQARREAQVKIITETESGYIGKDGRGFLLLDRDQNETLPGMRFRALSKPVDGVCVAKIDDSFALVDLHKNDFVDKTLRPYVGEMTKDGWALIKDQQEGMAPKYNFMNPEGHKMSREGFDYATEFKNGKASVMAGQSFGEIDTNGIVTKVEIKKTMEISETTKIRIY